MMPSGKVAPASTYAASFIAPKFEISARISAHGALATAILLVWLSTSLGPLGRLEK
jgi:hypothetical protein